MKRVMALLLLVGGFASASTTVNFDSPGCPSSKVGTYGGITWPSVWGCEKAKYTNDTTKSISWTSQITSSTFSFVSPAVLTELWAGGGSLGSITISTDQGEHVSLAITQAKKMTDYVTGFTLPATVVTVTYAGGWTIELDNLVYSAGPAPPAPIAVTISPTNVSLPTGGQQPFTATVSNTTNLGVIWSAVSGMITIAGLYTAPSTAGFDTVTATSAADTTKSASANVTITSSGGTPGGTTIFYDDFSGTTLSPAWTVISRHGEYAQGETECNVPSMVTVNNGLTITTEAQSSSCGDYFHTASTWPYMTGDIQWASFNFLYGTVSIEAKFPSVNTGTWPATWLLGSNCQYTNPLTGDTGVAIAGYTCPSFGASGYTEIDMTECYGSSSNWCGLSVYNPGSKSGCQRLNYAADSNWHLYKTVWNSSGVTQYVDGTKVASCNQNLKNPMFLIIQNQTGGVAGTPNNANLPTTLQIQYVQVTQP